MWNILLADTCKSKIACPALVYTEGNVINSAYFIIIKYEDGP